MINFPFIQFLVPEKKKGKVKKEALRNYKIIYLPLTSVFDLIYFKIIIS
jgi:hypothetical protein